MPKFKKGNMLNHLNDCDFAFITTNSYVKNNGRLVMGRGIAQQVRDSFPDIDLDLGKTITSRGLHLKTYDLIQSQTYPKIWAFQVKWHWADKANLTLIESACDELSNMAQYNYDKVFYLNFPGIGNGQLSREEVLPIVEQLPDNVTIWEL